MQRFSIRWVPGLMLGAVLFLLSCNSSPSPTPPASGQTMVSQLPIVGGQLETGWQGVGALTFQYPGYGYQGSFCTGALIAPNWVLTAAHCLTSTDEFQLWPDIVMFYVGNNANPSAQTGWPAAGSLYQADAFYPHPDYDPDWLVNDIGLVHLSEPATGVATYALNTTAFDSEFYGASAFYVGFGATEGVTSSGTGIKRSAYIDISDWETGRYYSEFNGTGTCFGDSGGPGFLSINGQTVIIGVTSAGSSQGPDPCQTTTVHTRVDDYIEWINDTKSTPVNCHDIPDLCLCAAACQTNGSCNNALCPPLDCEEIYTCMVDCNGATACQSDCYARGSDDGKAQVDAMLGCFQDACGNVADAEFQACAAENCSSEVSTCFPAGTGPLSCREIYECITACPTTDQNCPYHCYEQGTSTAQPQYEGMITCFSDHCSGLQGDAFSTCAYQYCTDEIETCLPPVYGDQTCAQIGDCMSTCTEGDQNCYTDCYLGGTEQAQTQWYDMSTCANENCTGLAGDEFTQCLIDNCGAQVSACWPPTQCDLTGGDCEDGTACWATQSGDTNCFESDGLGLGFPCDPTVTERLVCADGLLCITASGESNCRAFCSGEADCGADENCIKPAFPDLELDIGFCYCVDADQDGWCATEDCNDDESTANPASEEACDDGIDNNCDGQTDEGCTTCTDVDGDGSCSDEDCDDQDASVHPGAVEVCGDQIDNDCDGQTDEGCTTCTDADSDDYCADEDCDDHDAAVHPGAVEACGDQTDNDCDGQTDEDCSTCTDADNDGYCAEVDCDDNDTTVSPGADETCNDDIDNDCDGQADEGCMTCEVDDDGDGYCANIDCDDQDAGAFPGADEVCGDHVDNDCNGAADDGCPVCIDADSDGACATDDCNDQDGTVHPGGIEVCSNNIDNDCDGQTDEGCESCNDQDGDGYCSDTDCDDADAAVHPQTPEVCDNNTDDDCNGQTDEGCTTCIDLDSDGACSNSDCNDNDATAFPGAPELCDDTIDNDCDGQVDENCAPPCTDGDGDGACANVDCNDQDAAINAGAAETCDDSIDNNCNGQTDEGCETLPPCTDGDNDGSCADVDCNDGDAAVNPTATETCDDGIDNNCNGQTDELCTPDDQPEGGGSGGGCNTGAAPDGALAGMLLLGLALTVRLARRRQPNL